MSRRKLKSEDTCMMYLTRLRYLKVDSTVNGKVQVGSATHLTELRAPAVMSVHGVGTPEHSCIRRV